MLNVGYTTKCFLSFITNDPKIALPTYRFPNYFTTTHNQLDHHQETDVSIGALN